MTSEAADKPWLENKQWASREIRDKLSPGDFWFQMLLIFLITGGPAAILIGLPIAAGEPFREAWINYLGGAFMFLLFGAYLYSFRSDLRYGRNNVCRLVTLPGVISGWFKADVECNMPLDSGSPVLIRLENVEWSGKSKEVLWALEQHLAPDRIQKLPDGRAVVPVRLHIALQREQKSCRTGSFLMPAITWTLTVSRQAKPVEFSTRFFVPVYHTSVAPPDEQLPNRQSLPAGKQRVVATHAEKQEKLRHMRIFTALVGLPFMIAGAPGTWNVWRLADEGKEANAKVTALHSRSCGRYGDDICETHTLFADGHKFEMTLDTVQPVGSEMKITYLPRNPKFALPGSKSDSPWLNLFRAGTGTGAAGTEAVLAFFFGLLISAIGLVVIRLFPIEKK